MRGYLPEHEANLGAAAVSLTEEVHLQVLGELYKWRSSSTLSQSVEQGP